MPKRLLLLLSGHVHDEDAQTYKDVLGELLGVEVVVVSGAQQALLIDSEG